MALSRLIAVGLLGAALIVGGCGDGDGPRGGPGPVDAASLDGEPGGTTPVLATTPAPARRSRPGRRPTPGPGPADSAAPTGDGASAGAGATEAGGPTPRPTIAPRATPVPSGPVERAFLRQLNVALLADQLGGDAAVRLGTRRALQDFGQELRDRENPMVNEVTFRMDGLRMGPLDGMDGEELVADGRTLGIPTTQLLRSRNLVRADPVLFASEWEQRSTRNLDAEIVDLLLTHHEDTLALVTGTIAKEGNASFLPLARRVERWMRDDLPTLRRWKRQWQ